MQKLLLTAASALFAGCAFADDNDLINPDRPGIADGSTVIGRHFQIEAGLQHETHDAGHTSLFFVPTLFRFGIDNNWEIRVEGNGFTYADSFGMKATGYQTESIGFKYHFMDPKGTKNPSLGVIARVFPPLGSAGFQSDKTQEDIRLAADWALNDQWSINPNIGFANYEDGNGSMFTAALFAMTLGYNPTPTLNFFIDTGIQGPEASHGQNSVIFDAGVAYIIGKNLQLDFSVGTGVSGQSAPRPFIGAGVSVRL